jgi:hypothetical protein
VKRQVKGALFVDYVRMLRGRKDVDWSQSLAPEDLDYLKQRIEPNAWYPMETFERMGLAILGTIAGGHLALVEEWGRGQIDSLCAVHPHLVAMGNPCETLMRFQVLRQSFFDYGAIEIREMTDTEAIVEVAYHMGAAAEEAACHQTLGFFERLLEASGAREVQASFTDKSWKGDLLTTITLRWK